METPDKLQVQPGLWLIIAVVIDWWSRRRRDWIHWFGIFAFAYNQVIETGLPYVVFMFLD